MRAFDTYTHINELKKAGFKEEQAAVIIKSLMDSRETDFASLATKEQVANLERTMAKKEELAEAIADVTDRIAELRTELKTEISELRTALKTEISELRTEIKDLQINLIKWMVGLMIAFSGIIFAGIQ